MVCCFYYPDMFWGQTINFDTAVNWVQGSSAFNSYASDHVYSASVGSFTATFTGGPALRQTTTDQDGFAGAYGTYAWRLQNDASVNWNVTITASSIDGFSFKVRRWDGVPTPDFNIDYSIDNGSNWTTIGTINNTLLNNTSDWTSFFYNSQITGGSNIKIRIKSNGTTERIMIDDFSFTNPLPVQLISFSALPYNNSVKLNWVTATEVNNYGFELERLVVSNKLLTKCQQLNANGWQLIAFIPGHGNSNSLKSYSYIDNLTLGQTHLQYRLKQIDFNGAFEYSHVVEVKLEMPTEFKLEQNYPNPFNPATVISYQIPKEGHVSLIVYDLLGKEIITLVNEIKQPGKYSEEFRLKSGEYSSGIYFYMLKYGDVVQTKKLTLIK